MNIFLKGNRRIVVELTEEIDMLKKEKKRIVEEALLNSHSLKVLKEERRELLHKNKLELEKVEHQVRMIKEKNTMPSMLKPMDIALRISGQVSYQGCPTG